MIPQSYGTWTPNISAEMLTATGVVAFEDVISDGETWYWIEERSSEDGRRAVVACKPGGEPHERLAAPWSAGSQVYEYGGSALAAGQGTLYFVNLRDQRIYRQDEYGTPRPLVPYGNRRFGDLQLDSTRNRLLAVCEDHTHSDQQPAVLLVALPLTGGEPECIVSGNDFYVAPRVSPDGKQLAWITWNHPNMPWDGSELWVASLDKAGRVESNTALLVAGTATESVCHPQWSPTGELYFLSDRTNWWNLYRYVRGQVQSVAPIAGDYGRPRTLVPASFSFTDSEHIVGILTEQGISRLVSVNTTTGTIKTLENHFPEVRDPRFAHGKVAFLAGSHKESLSLWCQDLTSSKVSKVRSAISTRFDECFLPQPETIAFPTQDGETAYAYYYAPCNPMVRTQNSEKPPLLVNVHGGPVAANPPVLLFGIYVLVSPVFWTSRGYAVLDVAYRGTTGYGRAYRERLFGRWGAVSADDCIAGARFLVERGNVDSQRIAIRGASAGGYTTLYAVTFRNFFKAGTSYFGTSDLTTFDKQTHKYESHYSHHLIGPWPQERQRYYEESPGHFVHQIHAPLLVMQGLEDKVIPPAQSEYVVDGLRKLNKPVVYATFEGEGHGFVRAESVQRALALEEAFYAKVFGFDHLCGNLTLATFHNI